MSTFDDYAMQWQAEAQESLQARELNELAAGTEAIERGMGDGWLWFWLAVGIAGAPFTLGISLLISVWAGIKMNGGAKHMIKAALPMTVDVAAPLAGGVRVVSSLITLVLVGVVVAFIGALVLFNLGAFG